MIARAERLVTFHAAATPDLCAVLRMRLAEGEPLRAEIDVSDAVEPPPVVAPAADPLDYAPRWRRFLALPDDN